MKDKKEIQEAFKTIKVPMNSDSFDSDEQWCTTMAKAIDGEAWHTGGGVWVCYKQLDHAWLGISTETICLFKSIEDEQNGAEPTFMIDDDSTIVYVEKDFINFNCISQKCLISIHQIQPAISVIEGYSEKLEGTCP